jgi:hypothetical protein
MRLGEAVFHGLVIAPLDLENWRLYLGSAEKVALFT